MTLSETSCDEIDSFHENFWGIVLVVEIFWGCLERILQKRNSEKFRKFHMKKSMS